MDTLVLMSDTQGCSSAHPAQTHNGTLPCLVPQDLQCVNVLVVMIFHNDDELLNSEA